MTLDRDDIRAIRELVAEELARILGPKLGVRSAAPETEEETCPLPGSYAARKREALERHAASRERRKGRAKQ